MKIKDIAAIIKKSGVMYLTEPDENGVQFAGDGAGMYFLNVPFTIDSPAQLLQLMDIENTPDKPFPAKIVDYSKNEMFRDEAKELPASESQIRIDTVYGNTYSVFNYGDRCMLIQTRYLKCKDKETMFFVRQSEDGRLYLVAKHGLFLYAVILPVEINKELNINTASLYQLVSGLNKRMEKMKDGGPIKDPATGKDFFE